MALKTFKPYTKSTRGTVVVDKSGLWKGGPYKPLTRGQNFTGGRNNNGRITSRHIGGGSKHKYRVIDFYRKKKNISALVERIEYDPNRTAYIALITYKDNEKSYIICPQGLKVGDTVESGKNIDIKVGNSLELKDIPPGTSLHNVELIPGNGAKLARSAGSSVTLSGYDGDYAILRLSSGEMRKVSSTCLATIGVVSNPDQKNIKIGKAGRNRWRGKRPQTRGVAMNPVDHPHGGGEGKTSGGRSPVSPWGQSAKGLKTRKPKRSDKFIIARRRKGINNDKINLERSFCTPKFIKKIDKLKGSQNKKPIKTWSRNSTIIPDFVGHSFMIHNGKSFIPITISEEMVGHKLGELAPTRTFKGHTPADKKAAAVASAEPKTTGGDKK